MKQATVGAFDAKTHLSQLLDRVAEGEVIEITRRGRPVAKLVPCADRTDAAALRGILNRVRDERGTYRISTADIEAWKAEGRG